MKKILLIFLLTLSLKLVGQVPKTINFQGYLTDPSGTAIDAPSPGLSMTFSLWDATPTGGNKLWEETWNGVIVVKGLYNVNLGETTPMSLPFDKIYYLEVKVGLQTLTPRITLTSNAYSISSINASNITSGTLNGALVGSGINASNITTGTLAGAVVGVGTNVQAYDADWDDLADGSLSGSNVGTGINASNISSGDLNLASGKFSVSGTSGNISKINNVTYNFPSSIGS